MSDNYVPDTGGCLCQAVRYEADVNLSEAFYCHCITCQKSSGAPTEHICVESQFPWYELADNLPRKRSEDDPDLVEVWASAGLTHDGKPL